LLSKKACWSHQFRYLGVANSIPPFFATLLSAFIAGCGFLTAHSVRDIRTAYRGLGAKQEQERGGKVCNIQ
jgi:hypothetical protein